MVVNRAEVNSAPHDDDLHDSGERVLGGTHRCRLEDSSDLVHKV